MRRLRQHAALRDLLQETHLSVNDLVLPLFIKEGIKQKQAISSMPGHYQLSLQDLDEEIDSIVALKIPAVILFGIPSKKDATGVGSCRADGIIQRAIQHIKQRAPQLLVVADCCFCEFTDHGHCGVVQQGVDNQFELANDETLALLAQQAVSFARAGADMVAPSGMIDGMVVAIREALDQASFNNIPILSYAVKYASSFYGPFREAAEGAPQFGDRRSYQMNPANSNEAIREAQLDIDEAADILMVKPAGAYLDVIYRIKQQFPQMPLCAYQVSGEYAMIKAAAEKGWLDEKQVMMESLLAIKRAGANFIINYFAKDVARLLNGR
ncbi:MAG: porphobilinogen synthase [Gammaproteobacteria bacterium]|nr:porphobilinogen synthase [Gammaproteobacteria bacterium]